MFSSVILLILTVSSALSEDTRGLMNIFDEESDYNLAAGIDIAFGLIRNDIEFLLTGAVTTPIEEDVTFWCGNRKSTKLNQTYLDDTDIQLKIDFTKPIMFVTHGWLDNHTMNWIQETAQDAIEYIDTNVCIVGWGHLSRYTYHQSARKHTLLVSAYMTQLINFLNHEGMPLDKVTLAGHSLGAQICGQVGYNFDGKLGQIYGIDPAGPLFTFPFDLGRRYRLDKSDAKYVQMILTSRRMLGVAKGDGHENFYPNGGDAPQPNCVIPLTSDAEVADQIACSHLHATSLFRLSLNPALVFKGRRCFNWAWYVLKTCNLHPADVLGVHSQKLAGDFYLRTAAESPYVLY